MTKTSVILAAESKIQRMKVYQSLVHVVHNVSLTQYKLWLLLLQHVKTHQPDKSDTAIHDWEISHAAINRLLGIHRRTISATVQDLQALRKTDLVINILDKDNRGWQSFFSFIGEFSVNKKDALIQFNMPDALVEMVRSNDESLNAMFLMLNWSVFSHMSNKYDAMLYKLCKDYEGIGQTAYIEIARLRLYFGMEDTDYTRVNNFISKCIKTPIKRLNQNETVDIQIDTLFQRQGHKIHSIKFLISKKENVSPLPLFEPATLHPAFLYSRVAYSLEEQEKLLAQFDTIEIQYTIKRANQYIDGLKEKNKEANIGGVYNKAFQECWGKDIAEQRKTAKRTQLQVEQEQYGVREKKEQEQKRREKREQKARAQREIQIQAWQQLPADKQTQVKTVLLQGLSAFNQSFARSYFEQNNWELLFLKFRQEMQQAMAQVKEQETISGKGRQPENSPMQNKKSTGTKSKLKAVSAKMGAGVKTSAISVVESSVVLSDEPPKGSISVDEIAFKKAQINRFTNGEIDEAALKRNLNAFSLLRSGSITLEDFCLVTEWVIERG